MKILNISNIGDSSAMPIKSGTLQFLQDAHKETIAGLITNILPNPDPNTIYILSGCKNSTVAPTHTLSAGILYYNSEIFNFDGATFTLTGLQKAYARIETTPYLINADPVIFTNGFSYNVHNIRKFVVENTITSSGLPEFKDFVTVPSNSLRGDLKEIVCDNTYLNTYFDATGLGRLERTGWAITNGQNGTPSDAGRVIISYGGGYTLGQTGGVESVILNESEMPIHSHGGVPQIATDTDRGVGNSSLFSLDASGITNTTGGNQPHTNMQPYVVRLRIMKL